MSFDKCPRFKDPFCTSPLPRSFYHPTPSREVDSNVVIQSLERKDDLSKKSSLEQSFKTGSTFQPAELPRLKNVTLRNDVSLNNVTNSDDGYNETWPKSEQPSISALMDASQLTSSLDEPERDVVVGSFVHQHGNKSENSCAQDGSVSVIQKYINRFRYSAPKSREERVKETSNKNNTFWWLNSDASSPEVIKSSRQRSLQSSSNVDKQKDGMKLTREAVLDLDKETSDLQLKADKLLSKSQLSLVSSGPCVSTDGLGSSSAFSECSYRTDPQPAYRPIFVNLQGELQPPAPASKNYYRNIEEKPLSPDDVLSRWRMRRKMEDVQQKGTHMTAKVKPAKNHTEMDIRLEEFRKKLFGQRALVTTEDIQFERQRMKFLVDDEHDENQQKAESQPDKKISHKTESSSSSLPTEDPILSRLRQITRTDVPARRGNFTSINQNAFHSDNEQKNINSSNANITHHEPDRVIQISHNDHAALNTNNTALDQRDSHHLGNGNYFVDDMSSVSVCDAKQKVFSLNSNSTPTTNRTEDVHRKSDDSYGKDPLDNRQRQTESRERNQQQIMQNKDKDSLYTNGIMCDSEFVSEQNVPYHQRLQAEKPCDDSNDMRQEKTQPKQLHHHHIKGDVDENIVSKSDESSDSSKRHSGKEKYPQNSHKMSHKETGGDMYVDRSELSDVSSEKSESSRHSKNQRKKNNDNSIGIFTGTSQTKQKSSEVIEQKSPEETDSGSGSKRYPRLSQQQNKIQKVIGETVVDHLFDGPSMISSVDSWASLFPQSPMQSHSFHNSTTVTPTKDVSSCDQITSTPQMEDAGMAREHDDSNQDPTEEFMDDPLMNLLLQQKKEYIRKLELIELKLQQLDDS